METYKICILYIGSLGLILYIFRKLLAISWGKVNRADEENVKGKVVIITGANGGIGKATAIEMARRGATVILACRSMSNAKQTIVDIRNRTFSGKLVPMRLDLGSLHAVKEFYHEVIAKYDKIDILINNGGVMVPAREKRRTPDGFEINFGVNHLGHFLLTNLLLPLLKNAGSSRIITVSSITSKIAKLNFDDLMLEKSEITETMSNNPVYKNSKLANALFSQELGKRLEGTDVHTYCVFPGVIMSSISRHLNIPWYLQIMVPVKRLIMRTAEEGCQTTLYCAVSKQCAHESGLIYRNCQLWSQNKFTFPDDLLVPGKRTPLCESDGAKLWTASEKLIQIKFPL